VDAVPYLPIFEVTRGNIVESIHNGAIAVVDCSGNLVAWYGDPGAVTFLRSTAKPFQALPFIQHGGQAAFNLTQREVALICASHSGTEEQVRVVQSIQAKTGVLESDLLCGTHYPYDEPTAEAMRERKEQPTPNQHNCSGKHTGMVAYARWLGLPTDDYINPLHPIQQEILHTFAEMCNVQIEQVELGIDGCSAPNFAVPLSSAALALSRLCDPVTGKVAPPEGAAACQTIVSAMVSNPDMVGGPGRFDTRLMEVGNQRILVKAGAEGYEGIGLLPGALRPGSPALGVAIKIADGDSKSRARPAVTLEVLRQLGALSQPELDRLAEFGPTSPVENWRKIEVGQARPCFQLERAA
jgi:L-asparaginase II